MSRLPQITALLFVGFFVALVADWFFVDNVHPHIMMGVCILFIFMSLLAVILSNIGMIQKESPISSGVASIGFCVVVIATAIFYLKGPLLYLEYQPVAQNFQSFCSEQSLQQPETLEEKKYHSFIAIDSPKTQGKWMMYPIDLNWTPKNPEDIELVGCFHESQRLIETCHYTGATVERFQYQVWVTLLDAKNGKVIIHQRFEGSEPGKCLSVVSGSGEIMGSKVEWTEIGTWLQRYVNPVE